MAEDHPRVHLRAELEESGMTRESAADLVDGWSTLLTKDDLAALATNEELRTEFHSVMAR